MKHQTSYMPNKNVYELQMNIISEGFQYLKKPNFFRAITDAMFISQESCKT